MENQEQVQEEVQEDYDIGEIGLEDGASLDQLMSGEIEEREPEQPEQPEPEQEETPKEELNEDSKEEPEAEPKAEGDNDALSGMKYALSAERERRRLAEEKLKEQQKPEEKKEFNWENPEASLEDVKIDFQNQLLAVKLDISAANCMERHEDYAEKEKIFMSMVSENPTLANQMLSQLDPAEWAYKEATKHLTMKEIGSDPNAYKENLRNSLREEVRAELMQELGIDKKQEVEKRLKEVAGGLPPSAARIPGKKQNTDEIVIHDDPLKAAGFNR